MMPTGTAKNTGSGGGCETAVRLGLSTDGPATVRIEKSFTEPIVDFQTATVELDVTETTALAGILVSIDIEHTYIGDLVVKLIPPDAMAAQPWCCTTGRTAGRRICGEAMMPSWLRDWLRMRERVQKGRGSWRSRMRSGSNGYDSPVRARVGFG